MNNKPPFQITPLILKLNSEIFQKIGQLEGQDLLSRSVQLRKQNQIKTIQASLAIEGNSLSLEQVTDIINGKRVLAPHSEILEVKNAINVYDKLNEFNPLNINDLLYAHDLLMHGLVSSSGKLRSTNVGIFKLGQLAHMAPSHKFVHQLINNLFDFLKDNNFSWLIKSCVFHYEFEYIHPFEDGNGRMGRLWQQLILIKENKLFEFVSIEEIIKNNQQEYYAVLKDCDESGDSTKFIEFSLSTILKAIDVIANSLNNQTCSSRLEYSKNYFTGYFSRADYASLNNISTATASRDLKQGVLDSILDSFGEKNQTRYKFK